MDATSRRLMVADEIDMQRSLGRILRLKGCEVATASNGTEAIQVARKFDTHGMLTDTGTGEGDSA